MLPKYSNPWRPRCALLPALLLLAACERQAVPGDESPPSWGPAQRPDLVVELSGEGGAPVAGWVTVLPLGRDAATDADGLATFARLGAGTYELLGSAPGFEQATAVVEVGDGGASTTLALEPLDQDAVLGGRVRDPYGEGVVGATVLVEGVAVATTAADGTFEARLVGGPGAVEVRPPEGSPLRPWRSPGLSLAEGERATIDVTLPGSPPDSAALLGSDTCAACHGEQAEAWRASVHARVARTPAELADDPTGIDEAFEAGAVVALPSGSVTLSAAGGDWFAEVGDGASTSGALPVVEVYGGHRHGAAFAVQDGAERLLLPVAWAAPTNGLSSRQLPAGFVPAWVEGWFTDAGELRAAPEADYDAQCAGCHEVGAEQRVGCEACHGPGSAHLSAGDERRLQILHPGRLPGVERIEVCEGCHGAADHFFEAVEASPGFAAHAAELRASPHHRGPSGYNGACADCHAPHAAGLHVDPWRNALCTGCHATDFPDLDAEIAHGKHGEVDEIPFGEGTCVGCHMARAGVLLRTDPLSHTGTLRSHALVAWRPEDVLAEFDAADGPLGPGEVPVLGCLDCHQQVQARLEDEGGSCPCPSGDPLARRTYEVFVPIFDFLWESP